MTSRPHLWAKSHIALTRSFSSSVRICSLYSECIHLRHSLEHSLQSSSNEHIFCFLIPETIATEGDDATVNVSLIGNKYVVTLRGKDSAADKAILRKHINDGVASYTWDVIYDKAELDALLANKVDKVQGKSLVLDTEITKLGTVAEGATKVEASETNGNIKINGVETKVYDDAALAGRVSTIEGDYLKAADKTELQGNIDKKQNALTEATILGGGGAADWQ